MSVLPLPKVPGPSPAQPGHFPHHDWLTAAVKALDLQGLLVLGSSVSASTVSGTFAKVNLDTVIREVDAPHALQGGGDVVLGDGWVRGLYLVAGSSGFGGQSANPTGARSVRVLKDGATAGYPTLAQVPAAPGAARPVTFSVWGVMDLAAGAVLTMEVRQDSGEALSVASGSTVLVAYRLVTL